MINISLSENSKENHIRIEGSLLRVGVELQTLVRCYVKELVKQGYVKNEHDGYIFLQQMVIDTEKIEKERKKENVRY